MSLVSMTVRRIRKVLAWVFAVVILTLMGAGAFWVATELGWIA